MPKLIIWNEREIDRYDNPPEFNSYQRKNFLILPVALEQKLQAFHTLTNRVGFHLMFGYFKAARQFFTPSHFHMKDVQFVCRRLNAESSAVDITEYNRETYRRHRKIILDFFGYEAFKVEYHKEWMTQAIEKQLQAYVRPNLIMNFVLELLTQKHIERPPYNTLQTIITIAIRQRNRQLTQKLENLITEEHKVALDRLVVQENETNGSQFYRLTWLKNFNVSDRYKHIRENVEKHCFIMEMFNAIRSLLEPLKLSTDAIFYFGELVIRYEIFQIIRRDEATKYLLLSAFTNHQVSQFEDLMIDTFLTIFKPAINQVQNQQKEELFTNRKRYKTDFKKMIDLAENKLELLRNIQDIVWKSDENLSHSQKIKQIQQLLMPFTKSNLDQEAIQNLRLQYEFNERFTYYRYLEEQSRSLQKQGAGNIIKQLHFNPETSDKKLIAAIQHFKYKDGQVTKTAPVDFLEAEDKEALFDNQGKFRVSLYKMFLFRAVFYAIKDGSLNLKYSYRYKAFDDYLIDTDIWQRGKYQLLQRADLNHLKNLQNCLSKLKPLVDRQYQQTNCNISDKKNLYFRFHKDGKYQINTPKNDSDDNDKIAQLFPIERIIPLSEVLATTEKLTGFLKGFQHFQPRHPRNRPSNKIFFAGITAYGCNLGIETMAKSAFPITASELEYTANWYFTLANIDKANDIIVEYMNDLKLPDLYRQHKEQLHTASDGQKINIASVHSIHATHSFKYFGKGKGVSAYSFIDERYIPFYSTVINTSEREAIYVIDGLLHNESIRSTLHSTDTHGYTEAVFGLSDLLGFSFAPRIARLYKQQLYSFTKKADYQSRGYQILPKGYINTTLIEENWDNILRLVTSIKLKHCSVAQIFKRLNSYSRQHPVYQALKEYGKIIKTLYILRYIDNYDLRQVVQKQLNKVELSNRFSDAVFFANGGEMIFLTRQEQLVAEACKRLIKNVIVCWNYLYLTRRIQRVTDENERLELIEAVKAGSAIVWKHIYFHGVYDFSDEKLTDSFNLLQSQNFGLDLE